MVAYVAFLVLQGQAWTTDIGRRGETNRLPKRLQVPKDALYATDQHNCGQPDALRTVDRERLVRHLGVFRHRHSPRFSRHVALSEAARI
jgi:hypothetical protein